ncbi:MAG: alpha/beta hydrolase, partial [Mycobacterium sp.]
MTRSLPGEGAQRSAPWAAEWASHLQSTATSVGLKVAPFIPTTVKRLLTGARSVTIDGNTLDPTLQLMLAAQRALGIDGLVIDDDVHTSRTQARQLASALAGKEIHVDVTDISLPGPAGDIPARHYRPLGSGA